MIDTTDTLSLDAILDRLVEMTPPIDDPAGAETCFQLSRWILLRNLADHHIGTHTAELDSLGVADKDGSMRRDSDRGHHRRRNRTPVDGA